MGKTLIKIDCVDQRLIITSAPTVASGGKNEDEVEFNFCSKWDNFEKVGVFYRDVKDPYKATIDPTGRCVIPWEVLTSDGYIFIGAFGVKDDITRTTEILKYKVKLGAITEDLKPSDPTPELWEQVFAKVLNQEIEMRAVSEAVEQNKIDIEDLKTDLSAFEKNRPFDLIGNPVQVESFEGMPLNPVTVFEPKQAGSGDPSPTNIRPITGYDALGLNHAGKNLLTLPYRDGDVGAVREHNGVTFVVNVDGSITVNGTATSDAFFRLNYFDLGAKNILPDTTNGTYVLSGMVRYTASIGTALIYLNAGTVCDNVTYYPQVELGTVATAFEPLKTVPHTVQIGQIVYGGRMDWNTGKLTAEYGYVELTGNETITEHTSSSGDKGALIANVLPVSEHRVDGVISHDIVSKYLNVPGMVIGNASRTLTWVGILDKLGLNTVDEFKAWLAAQRTAGTPVQISHKLATPVEIQLTPHEISALHGVNTLYGDGEINISGRTDMQAVVSNLLKRIAALESKANETE